MGACKLVLQRFSRSCDTQAFIFFLKNLTQSAWLQGLAMSSEKEHLSIVICGHVDSGKSTTTGRLIFELGGLPERELEKLKQEAERLGKGSFAFAFYMDRQKEERERGVTIACTTKEFYTEKWHYTIIDAPGHRDFIKVSFSCFPSTVIARGSEYSQHMQEDGIGSSSIDFKAA